MPIPKLKKKVVHTWHIHASIIIAVGLAALCGGALIVALEWIFS